MARLFLDERNLREAGVHQQNINTLRELTEFLNLVTQVQTAEEDLVAQQAAIDAVEEAVEDQELSLTSLDARVDDLEDFEALGPYAKLSGATFVGAVAGTTAAFNSIDIAGEARCNSFRLDQTPVAEAIVVTHSVTISVDGTNYKFAVQAA